MVNLYFITDYNAHHWQIVPRSLWPVANCLFFFIKALGINLHSVHIPSFLYLIRSALQLTPFWMAIPLHHSNKVLCLFSDISFWYICLNNCVCKSSILLNPDKFPIKQYKKTNIIKILQCEWSLSFIGSCSLAVFFILSLVMNQWYQKSKKQSDSVKTGSGVSLNALVSSSSYPPIICSCLYFTALFCLSIMHVFKTICHS